MAGKKMKTVLTIVGSDPSGGADIHAGRILSVGILVFPQFFMPKIFDNKNS